MLHTFRRLVLSALMVALVVRERPLDRRPAPRRRSDRRRLGLGPKRLGPGDAQHRPCGCGTSAPASWPGRRPAALTAPSASPALNPGTYVVEVVNAGGAVVGTSAAISLTARSDGGQRCGTQHRGRDRCRGGWRRFLHQHGIVVAGAAAAGGVAGVVVASNRPTPAHRGKHRSRNQEWVRLPAHFGFPFPASRPPDPVRSRASPLVAPNLSNHR